MDRLELGSLRNKCLVQLLHGHGQILKQKRTQCHYLCPHGELRKFIREEEEDTLTLRSDVGATALRCQVVLKFFYLLAILLQLHLKLLYQATEITKHTKKTTF